MAGLDDVLGAGEGSLTLLQTALRAVLAFLVLVALLRVGNNALSGPVPDLSASLALRGLRIDGNQITGAMPEPPAMQMISLSESLRPNSPYGPLRVTVSPVLRCLWT